MSALLPPVIPPASADALAEAVRALLIDQSQRLSSRAERTPGATPRVLATRLPHHDRLASPGEDLLGSPAVAAMIEGSYLVAAADGVAAEEERALALLIACAVGRGEDEIRRALARLGERLAQQGHQARLGGVARELHDFDAREEALSFAALIALADSTLAPEEATALLELGSHFGFSTGEVQRVVDELAARLIAQLD